MKTSIRGGIVALAFAGLVSAGCQAKMVAGYGKVRDHMLRGAYGDAVNALRAQKQDAYAERDQVMYYMDEGLLLNHAGRFEESNRVLDTADKRAEDLYTVSISKQAAATLTSDASTDYEGEDYERVFLNLLKSFNYIGLSKLDDAMVEVRKVDEKLKLYATKYEKKPTYNQDAFAHWLSGFLRESIEKDYGEALVSYKLAYEAYKNDYIKYYDLGMPDFLKEDLIRAARLAGDGDALALFQQEFPGVVGEPLGDKGEVTLIHLNGEAPHKNDFFINCSFIDKINYRCDWEANLGFSQRKTIDIGFKGTYALKIALPRIEDKKPRVAYVDMMAPDPEKREEIVFQDGIYTLNEQALRFATGDWTIGDSYFDELKKVAYTLAHHREIELLEISGHTDDRGNDQSNAELSRKRAAAVAGFLMMAGVEPWRLKVEGYGESQPLARGKGEAVWSRNRRVSLKILRTAPVPPPPMLVTRSMVAEPIDAIAIKALEDKAGRIFARAVLRAIVKYLATQAAGAVAEKASGSQLLGSLTRLAGNVTAQATEEADKRSWRTLPASINVAKLRLPPGDHMVTLAFKDASGFTVRTATLPVKVEAGKRTFSVYRTME